MQTETFDMAAKDVASDDEVEVAEIFDMGDRGRPMPHLDQPAAS